MVARITDHIEVYSDWSEVRDGKAKRRERRMKERKNKKNKQ